MNSVSRLFRTRAGLKHYPKGTFVGWTQLAADAIMCAGKVMFVAALIFVLSVAALGQFVWFYWRALLISTATEPVSDQLRQTSDFGDRPFRAADFHVLLGLRDLCPDLGTQREHWKGVRIYYGLLSLVKALPGPAARWAVAEQAVCSQYAAVLLDRRLRANSQYRLSMNHR